MSKRISNEGPEPQFPEVGGQKSAVRFGAVSKRFQMVGLRGSTLGKRGRRSDVRTSAVRFGPILASNDKKVPDPVGSRGFCNTKKPEIR